MSEICKGLGPRYRQLGQSQDKIEWRRFMEGMISKEVVMLQKQHQTVDGSDISLDNWASGLIIKLLEMTHGQ